MYLFHNAIKNLLRNKGRYLLVGGIITVMLIAVIVSAMINSTTKEIINDYVDRFNARVYFTHDQNIVAYLKPGEDGFITVPELSTEEFIRFADSEYLAQTLLKGQISAYSDSFKGLDQREHIPDPRFPDSPVVNCSVFGYSELSLIEEFIVGQREIINGRMFDMLNECIVSGDFASLNNLSIGDEISLFNAWDKAHTLNLTIVGIYLDRTTAQQFTGAANNRRNEILVSYETLTATRTIDSYILTKTEYFLKNPEYSDAFEAELRRKGLSEMFIVNVDSDNYYQIVEPVKGLSKISNVMMAVVLIFGGFILILLSILSVRERKYEIGVLRAMGMEKGKVVVGMLIESFAIITICLALGLGVGIAVAQPVSSYILNDQLEIAQRNFTPNQANHGAFISGLPTIDRVDYDALVNVDVKVTPDILSLTILIAFLLGLLSNSVGIFYITRFEPIRILSERD